jgi:hypothetical protein
MIAKQTKSEIFIKSHQIARILGYKNFPRILTDVWTIYWSYQDGFSQTKKSLSLKTGFNTSSSFARELAKYGFEIEKVPAGYQVKGTKFLAHNFKSGKVRMTPKSIKTLEYQLSKSTLLRDPNIKERSFIASQVAINNDGYRLLSNGDMETSNGFIMKTVKGFMGLYTYPVSTQLEYDQYCLDISKNQSKTKEYELQASLISFWNTLSRSETLDISVDYEIGVNSGKKVLDMSESRYDLVVSIDGAYELIELKKGVIDIATLNYKVGKMKMGVDNYCKTTTSPSQSSLVFIGSDIDERLQNIGSLMNQNKIKMYTYRTYFKRLEKIISESELNKFDESLAKVYLRQAESLI